MNLKLLTLPALLFASVLALAQPTPRPVPPDLPGNEAGQLLINEDPSVVQARHAMEAARERAVALAAGSYEWTAKASLQRRREELGGANYREWTAGIERAIRIGGKAGIDRELGATHERLAKAQYGEARREAARELLGFWMDWMAAERARQLWLEQQQLAQDNLAAVVRRRSAGDASLLEENSARVDVAEVQRQLSTARNEEAKARARLRGHFPTLTLQLAQTAEPQQLDGEPGQWRERILDESDELRVVREEQRLATLQAARARANRISDPTVGVYTSSERGGSERIVGLSLSMPFGSAARSASEREAARLAEAAQAAVEAKQREIEAEVAQNLADAAGSLERWRFAQAAQAASRDSLRMTQRAYSLGESDLQSLLQARRQGVEAALGGEAARIDALRAHYRLLVDAHLIWGLQDE